jgi:hypothetical protein
MEWMEQKNESSTMNEKVSQMFERLPVLYDWAEYKGETYFVCANPEASERAGKPMMDICYCATEALNNNVLFTVQFDKSKFSKSRLSDYEWKSIKEMKAEGSWLEHDLELLK